VTRRTDSADANASSKPNGHALDSPSHSLAASVDTGNHLAAGVALHPPAACAIPGSLAEVAAAEARGTRPQNGARKGTSARARTGAKDGAAPRLQGTESGANGEKNRDSESPANGKREESEQPKIPPGEEPLPLDGRDYVEAVHERMDLIELEVKLLGSKDEKIVQRELAYLRELRYGKTAATDEEEPRIIFDLPRPKPDPVDRDA
jgi:hypothetical protein